MSINKINSDTKKYTLSEVYLNLSPYLLDFNPILPRALASMRQLSALLNKVWLLSPSR